MDARAPGPAFDSADRQLAAYLFDSVRQVSAGEVGVTRPSYSDTETAALDIIAKTAREAQLRVRFDPAANIIIERPDVPAGGPAYWVGSHIDSVPEGGNYDGLAGIVAGLLCLRKLHSNGVSTRRPVTLIGLRGEESAWFGKPYLGSYAIFGELTAADLDRKQRDTRRTLREHMQAVGADVHRIGTGEAVVNARSIEAYLELHIEQGPIMVARQAPLAVVTGIRGNLRHISARCCGTAGHSGAVPRWLRHDAVFALAELLTSLDEHWQALNSRGVDLVVTSGVVATNPNEHSVSRIPGDVRFSLELRSQSIDTLEASYRLVLSECSGIESKRGVRFELGERILAKPALMNTRWTNHLRESCDALQLPYIDIPSGAGHDAAVFASQNIPAAMLFIRNDKGSHNPDEAMELDDFMMGVEVLYHTLSTAAPFDS